MPAITLLPVLIPSLILRSKCNVLLKSYSRFPHHLSICHLSSRPASLISLHCRCFPVYPFSTLNKPLSTSSHFSVTVSPSLVTPQGARDFIKDLDQSARDVLLRELTLQLEQSAATAPLAPDPSTSKPSTAQLRLVCLHNTLPFVGFGFLDNALMIIAGDYIDTTIGVTFGISTMAAAGLGNLLSDLAGLSTAHYVENLCLFLGMRPPELSYVQKEMRITRFFVNIGRAVGVVIGCLLGMFPLLFISGRGAKDKIEKESQDSEIQTSDSGPLPSPA